VRLKKNQEINFAVDEKNHKRSKAGFDFHPNLQKPDQ
jgi:hypothetical protein